MCYKDLEGGDEVGHRNRLVGLPLLVGLEVVDEDDEVVLLALVVDLDLSGFSLSHVGQLISKLFERVCLGISTL